MNVCLRLENKIPHFINLLFYQSEVEDFVGLAFFLLLWSALCWIWTTNKRAVKRATSWNVKRQQVSEGWIRTNMQIWAMHRIQAVRWPLNFSRTFFFFFTKLAPTRGLRGSCVEAVVHYVTCLRKHTCLQGFLPRHQCPCLQGGPGRVDMLQKYQRRQQAKR